MEKKLVDLGLTKELYESFLEKHSALYLGRVLREHKGLYFVGTEQGEVLCKVSGKMSYLALSRLDFPAVGDWVAIDRQDNSQGDAIIHAILPRKSKFSRKVAGNKNEEQIVAVNVETVFICMALNNDYNLRRLERYISLAWDSGAKPIVLLTKADLCSDVNEKLNEVLDVAIGVEVVVVSSLNLQGFEKIKAYVEPGKTIVFLGSSGVGKSTLINILAGNLVQKVQDTRRDEKGRHTTTHRELFVIANGGIVIDTPGMREIHILDETQGVSTSFADIEELVQNCRYSDCQHESEPGCAVKAALEQGILAKERYYSYKKLLKEAEFMERKVDKNAEINHKQKVAKFHKEVRRNVQRKR